MHSNEDPTQPKIKINKKEEESFMIPWCESQTPIKGDVSKLKALNEKPYITELSYLSTDYSKVSSGFIH